jgi:uncharacterized protein (TIGR03083 family)
MTHKELARDERLEFADFLAGLTPEQWESPTLCDRWRVRDVVAHTMSYEGMSFGALATRFLEGRLQTDRINELAVAEMSDTTPEELIDMIRRYAEPSGLGAGFGGRIALTDNMIHQQDIRRVLGIPRAIAPERLLVALDFARWAPLIRGAWRARGVRLVATDVDWSLGRGAEVRGPGEAMLMVMAGRPDALRELSGPGLPTLTSRL